jgi:methionyl-tRNA formyltransferase
MKKVLVVIDNVFQYERIKNIISEKVVNAAFIFKHSPVKSAIWEHEDFIDKTSSIIDVKEDLEFIKSTFDLVISVHCFQFFPKELVKSVRCVNIHPGYNPINRGWYPQVFAIVNQLQIGATIHEMDEKLDNGPIIDRSFVEKYNWDTSSTIYNRVLEKEMELLIDNFEAIIEGSYKKIVPESKGNMYSKKDFNELCMLDMNEVGSFKSFYDKLRALTHGDYKNAFFIDEESGKKVYVSIDTKVES